MMDLKFRVWSKDLEEYREFDGNSDDQSLGMGLEAEHGIGSNTISIYHSIGDTIEQFTGLKDKNGKDVYEGDVVRVSDVHGDVGYVDAVIWGGKDGYPAFDLKNHAAEYDSNALSSIVNAGIEVIEVIGNIHDNPELLEAEK